MTFLTSGRSRRWIYGLLALCAAVITTLSTPPIVQAVDWLDLLRRGFEVYQLSNLSDAQEVDLGRQIDRELSRQLRLVNNSPLNRLVDSIGQRLAAVSSRPNIPYTFRVVNSRDINAFATMGGFVYVNLGLMVAAENEAELAGVMAHEIGHITERHVVKNLRSRALSDGILSATGLDRRRATSLGVELALNLPRSRQAEFESDQVGVTLLQRAQYAPIGLPSFLQKLRSRREPPAILSTHPNSDERVARLLQLIGPNGSNGMGLDNAEYQGFVQAALR
ncbi:MAG: M48 family peptidase [Limnothrix sp. CACIAM 69d]|nr:MAG: M48 family peptidase [Limnothrix sp. CACIAM 69d]